MGNLIEEPVYHITIAMQETEDNSNKLVDLATKIKHDLVQDCVYVRFGGVVRFI